TLNPEEPVNLSQNGNKHQRGEHRALAVCSQPSLNMKLVVPSVLTLARPMRVCQKWNMNSTSAGHRSKMFRL
ncbi:MAG TPA: hypothetical protein DEX36_06385, partial [Glutamicibacter sp.]|nr:hypothetical protein [Glutamicibacter sp.]